LKLLNFENTVPESEDTSKIVYFKFDDFKEIAKNKLSEGFKSRLGSFIKKKKLNNIDKFGVEKLTNLLYKIYSNTLIREPKEFSTFNEGLFVCENSNLGDIFNKDNLYIGIKIKHNHILHFNMYYNMNDIYIPVSLNNGPQSHSIYSPTDKIELLIRDSSGKIKEKTSYPTNSTILVFNNLRNVSQTEMTEEDFRELNKYLKYNSIISEDEELVNFKKEGDLSEYLNILNSFLND